MTLVSTPRCFKGYNFLHLPEFLHSYFYKNPELQNRNFQIFIRLECFCEITGVTLKDCDETQIEVVLNDFAAAMFSCIFVEDESSAQWGKIRHLSLALPTHVKVYFPTRWNRSSWPNEFRERVEYFNQLTLDPLQKEFWQGWIVKNSAGSSSSLTLWRFQQVWGLNRTRELYSAIKIWAARNRHSLLPIFGVFIQYCEGRPEINFQDSRSVGKMLTSFLSVFIRTGYAAGKRFNTLTSEWQDFAAFMEDCLLGHAWAIPIPAMPVPAAKRCRGNTTHIKTTDAGLQVKASLLTPIPLQLTDQEAIELLFSNIQSDFEIVLTWARAEVLALKLRHQQSQSMADDGIVSEIGKTGINTGLRYRLSRECPEHLVHAAATLKSNGLNHFKNEHEAKLIYPLPLSQTTWELGLPQPKLLLAHGAILVAAHPQITPAFLETLEIFDVHGKLIGLLETDAGWHLCGFKLRRGTILAQQNILLTEETLQVIHDLIEVTQSLRDYLKKRKSPYWRRLFLGISTIGCAPNRWQPDKQANAETQWLAARIVELVGVDQEKAKALSKQFSLKKIRSSKAVLVFLETGSVDAMSKALGHAAWRPSLLERYLPNIVQDFFTERWIRLFQTGIICEALRESSYLLEASDFRSMDDLDQFLENHALRKIPAHLENPNEIGGAQSKFSDERVIFGINPGILSILISLEVAVRNAKKTPCGRAIRWARISEKLTRHLEMQSEQPEFQAMVVEAKKHINPLRVEGLIYG